MDHLQHVIVLSALCVLFSLLHAPSGITQERAESLIQAGVARTDITPSEPIRLSGYAGRTSETGTVVQKLWAKALAIGSDDNNPALLITADLLGIPAHVYKKVAGRLSEKTAVDRAHLAICATHTHSGPALSGRLPYLFGEPIPNDHKKRIKTYTSVIIDRLEEVALQALADRRPRRLAYGRGSVSFAVNRRVIEGGKWVGFGENPQGPVDHDMPVLKVSDPDGTVRVILVKYACHAVCLKQGFNKIHGDWPGAAQRQIEQRFPEAIAMVAIGAGGDANPDVRNKLTSTQKHGRSIAEEVEQVLKNSLQPISSPPDARFRWISLPFDHVPSRKELRRKAEKSDREGYFASTMLQKLKPGENVPSSVDYPLQLWTFGDQLAMLFMRGEPVAHYSLRLKREFDEQRLWVNGYANDLTCYIPSRRMIPQGGYEVIQSMYGHGHPSKFSPRVEEIIFENLREMIPARFNK